MTDFETASRRRLVALLILALPALLAACGKKGPLRLPEAAPASTPPPAPDADDKPK